MPLIGQELRSRLLAYRRKNWHRVQTRQWQDRIVDEQMNFDARPFIESVQARFELSGAWWYLDIGSGIGDYVLAARSLGINAFGIEPDRIGVGADDTSLAIARDRSVYDAQIFAAGVGEALPFPDATFDLVTMNQVLEHVQDVGRVLEEALRVTKPNGILLFNTPNYLSFYEPHYKVFWFPLFPRPLARIYLCLRGRTPSFLDGINYVTRGKFETILSSLHCDFHDETRTHLVQLLSDVGTIRRPGIRAVLRLMKSIGFANMALNLYLTFFVRGIHFVVVKDK